MRYTTKQDQHNALCQPFPIEAVKEREQGGKTLYYYPVEVVRTRLNEVFAGDYEFRVNQVFVTDTDMDMSCTLTLRWVDGSITIVEDWGTSEILRSKDGSRRVNEPAKSCSSDALKRCLAFVGCGAELWNETYRASIDKKKEDAKRLATESARFTCQECDGKIDGGVIGKSAYTAEEILKRSRERFHKRLCIPCIEAALLAKRGASDEQGAA